MWEEIIKIIGIFIVAAGTIAGLIIWIAKKIINHSFSIDLEKFKADLKIEAAKDRIRYEKMHNKRAEVIERLYKKIVRAYRALHSYMHIFQRTGDSTEKEKGEKAAKAANDFTDYFEENRIFIEESLAKRIDDLSKKFKEAWNNFDLSRYLRESKNSSSDYVKKWEEAFNGIDQDANRIKKTIERKFRKIIGIENDKK